MPGARPTILQQNVQAAAPRSSNGSIATALQQLWLLLVGMAITASAAIADPDSAPDTQSDAIVNERSITSRVLGGGDAEPGEWPSVVALVNVGPQALADRLFCGGSVVADRWILTAAHCLFDSRGSVELASRVRVVAGITDLQDDAFVEEAVVTNIYIHPEYDNDLELPPNDIALLELANVLDAPVAELFAGDTRLYQGTMAFVAGWGATEFANDVSFGFPDRLQDASVPLVSQAECNSPESYGGLVTSRQLCAGFREGGVDTCAGDSGGPLFIIENGQTLQVGITSFGNGCGLPEFFGIYTDVSHFIGWLGNYIAVPAQSAALIAEREAQEQLGPGGTPPGNTDNNRRGLFGAASHPLLLSILAALAWVRRTFARQSGVLLLANQPTRLATAPGTALNLKSITTLNWGTIPTRGTTCASAGAASFHARGRVHSGARTNTITRSRAFSQPQLRSQAVKALCVGTAVLCLSSGCAAHNAPGNKTKTGPDPMPNEEHTVLSLTEKEGKAGVGDIVLGLDRDEALQAFTTLDVTQSDCHTEKTSLKGTGRLFLKETCVFKPVGTYRLAELTIRQITAQFLDSRLVGLEWIATGTSLTELMKQVDGQYQQSASSTGPFEWISTSEDTVRLITRMSSELDDDTEQAGMSDVSIRMVEKAIDGRLPVMFQ